MTKLLTTPPANSRVDTVFNATLKLNPGKWAEYHSYKKRTTANATAYHIRKHLTSWTEPNVDYAAVTRRKPDGTYAVWVSAVRIKEDTDAETE
nr:MAG TPA: Large polyvalent protein associated domain 24 [Caudoviricetes sp.]